MTWPYDTSTKTPSSRLKFGGAGNTSTGENTFSFKVPANAGGILEVTPSSYNNDVLLTDGNTTLKTFVQGDHGNNVSLTIQPAATERTFYFYTEAASPNNAGISKLSWSPITTVPVTITSAGWATLYTAYPLDFSTLSANLTAYTATCTGSTVTLTQVDNVPANTGVVLKGAEDTYNIPIIASSSTDKGHLLGSATDATVYNAYSGYDLYMLVKNNDKAQFKKVTSGSIAAGKAFLKINNSGASSLAPIFDVVFADETTGISTMHNSQCIMHNEIYDLQGRKVAQPTKGLYIVNGKKVIVK